MAKLDGASFKDANYITAIFPQKASDNLKTRTELFRYAQETPTLKDYIKTHVSTINDLFLTVGSIRNTGQHAGAVIQTPEKDENGKPMEIYDWFPVKKVDGHLVSEWTGAELDKLGFIKNDFLGLNQLDKVKSIIDLVKANKNIVVELGRVPLKDEKTYFYFQEGFVQDIFQFSGDGMAAMIMELMPDNIEHLIAANALYRPGAMSSGFDKEYIKLRHGQKIPEFITGTEKALKDTMGLMIYQESTMSLVVEYAGFTMSMADDLRKAIGKKLPELMAEQKDKFIDGAKRLGRDQNDAIKIWEQIERTAEYQFNRCISGDEMFYRGSGGRWKPTIHEMYMIRNNREYAKMTKHECLNWKYRAKGYGMCFSLNEENKLVKNKIVDIRFEGVRKIYRVTLKNGATIDATMNHKFPTSNGDKKLEDIDKRKDKLFYNEGYEQASWDFSFLTGEMGSKIGSRWFDDERFQLNSERGKIGFQTRDTPYTRFIKYRKEKHKLDNCEICGLIFSDKNIKKEVHHVDGDHGNSDFDNLQLICSSCHKKEHYKMGRTKMGEKGLATSLQEIESIVFLKSDRVYDVEVEAPYHNFCTGNKVVTCNSHSVAYAILGYTTMYLKAHYPVEFYTIALQFANDVSKPKIISEMNRLGEVKVMQPSINESGSIFKPDFKTNKIYWSLVSVKWVGERAVEKIVSEREENGPYFSVKDLFDRVDKRTVNKRTIHNLILAGAFDEIYNLKRESDRLGILREYYDNILREELPEIFKDYSEVSKLHVWILWAKELTGLGYIDYKSLVPSSMDKGQFIDPLRFQQSESLGNDVLVSGVISKMIERNSKKGNFLTLEVEYNSEMINVLIWNETYDKYKKELKKSEGKIFFMNGIIKFDSYKSKNVVQSQRDSEIKIL